MSSSPYCLFATFAFWYVCPVTCNLYPVVEYYDIKGNEKYVNATIQAIGEHDLNTLFVFYIRALDGAVKNVLFSRWIDGCAFLRRPDSDRLIKIFFDVIKEYSKVPRCPYKRGDTMVLNITPSAWPIPSVFPATDFLLEVKTYIKVGVLLAFETRWFGSLVKIEQVKERWSATKGKN
uniref:Uncharacterized protein n=1 Tax=Anopheles coluzzii TaxID=1518534 RepID=A0A8W7P031_ANOCL